MSEDRISEPHNPGSMPEFRCTRCRKDVDLILHENAAGCPSCEARFGLLDGCIPNFVVDPGAPENFLGSMFREEAAAYDDRVRVACEHGFWVLEQLKAKEPGANGRGPGTILEIGAGTGQMTRALASGVQFPYERLFVTDLSADMLRINWRRRQPGEPEAKIRYAVCNSLDLPLPDHSVDIIFGMDILHHILDYPVALTEFVRVLAPGGFCVLEEPHRGAFEMFRFLCGVLLVTDTKWPFTGLTDRDRKQLQGWKSHLHNLMSADDRNDLGFLEKLDDKYLFDPDVLKKRALEAGFDRFSECNILYRPELRIPYAPMIRDNFNGLGLSKRAMKLLDRVTAELDDTIGQQMLRYFPVNTLFLFWAAET